MRKRGEKTTNLTILWKQDLLYVFDVWHKLLIKP